MQLPLGFNNVNIYVKQNSFNIPQQRPGLSNQKSNPQTPPPPPNQNFNNFNIPQQQIAGLSNQNFNNFNITQQKPGLSNQKSNPQTPPPPPNQKFNYMA